MSLLQFETFKMMMQSATPDGEGGRVSEWTEGTEFPAIANAPKSGIITVADAINGKVSYVITTRRNTDLHFYDVIKRVSDGMIFQITSLSHDDKTPPSASLDMRQYAAEKRSIPT